MPRTNIARIRRSIGLRQYDMTAHAMEEMAEDLLDITDVEHAVLNGRVTHSERDDPRGTKYVIEGIAADGRTPVGIVGRFAGKGQFLIITVYEIDRTGG